MGSVVGSVVGAAISNQWTYEREASVHRISGQVHIGPTRNRIFLRGKGSHSSIRGASREDRFPTFFLFVYFFFFLLAPELSSGHGAKNGGLPRLRVVLEGWMGASARKGRERVLEHLSAAFAGSDSDDTALERVQGSPKGSRRFWFWEGG